MKRVVSIFALLVVAGTAIAQESHECTDQYLAEKNQSQILLTLKSLSAEDKAMLEAQFGKQDQASKPTEDKLTQVKKQIQEAKNAATLDMKLINALIGEKHSLAASLEQGRVSFNNKMLLRLKDDQRAEFAEKKNGGK